VITVFKTGRQEYSNPIAITAGPDGNLWFTDCGTNAIGKITPSGEITEFVVNPDISYPWGITTGPDGNLWFTDCGTNAIGKITPSGVVTLFSSGLSLYSGPAEIIAGPDGNLWFTENYSYGNGYGGNKIGRITPSGVITEFSSLPTSGSGPWGIMSGPDGNIWFTEYHGGKIGRITPSGVITEFSIGLGGPQGIVTGPDGNIWFTEYDYNAIGRFSDFREGCSANLDASAVLNVPYLANQNAISGSPWVWANFIYEPNPSFPSLIPFKLTTMGLIDNPSSTCTPSTLYADLTIHIPDMTVPGGSAHLWVDLKYSPILSTAGKNVFVITSYGQVSN
jgi:streptogramin lyase